MTQHPPGAPEAQPPAAGEATAPTAGKTAVEAGPDGGNKTTDGTAGKDDSWLGGLTWGGLTWKGIFTNTRHTNPDDDPRLQQKAAGGDQKVAGGDQKTAGGDQKAAEGNQKTAEKEQPETAPGQTATSSAPAPGTAYSHQPYQPGVGMGYQHLYRSAMPPYTPATGAHLPPTSGHAHTQVSHSHTQVTTSGAPQGSHSVPPGGKEPAPMQHRSGLEQTAQGHIKHMDQLVNSGGSRTEQPGYLTSSLDSLVMRDLAAHRRNVADCESFLNRSSDPLTQKLMAENRASEQLHKTEAHATTTQQHAKTTQQHAKTTQQHARTTQQYGQSSMFDSVSGQDAYSSAKKGTIDGHREALDAQAKGMDDRFGAFVKR
ncbi:hypothetical protein [Endozoicomonas sp. SCSIO W0465]|uniref:hypothetical protein n=1 Tax=Endozoicomonas sp. SCSIO W0465 TaxID=2918516 RepID=UPI002075FD38|nr:hypothetical protein [Endozoicomonas sp. SCSIO W0465]USE37427.1 hypothetical protein MJO57_04155 [Endozoicomonas sp. SCSIO W0465]